MRVDVGTGRCVLLSGTSTRLAPAGRRPPKPRRQIQSTMFFERQASNLPALLLSGKESRGAGARLEAVGALLLRPRPAFGC